MKKLKLLTITTLILLFITTGCSQNPSASNGSSVNQKSQVVENQHLMFIETSNDSYLGDLYLKKGTNEKEKLSSDVQLYSYRFYPEKEITVFLDKDYNLYIKEIGKEKELISADGSYNYDLLQDGSGIIFLKSDSELYRKLWNQEKDKISSEVLYYDVTADGKTIFFTDYEDNLYIKKDNVEKDKIASNVMNFFISDNGSVVYYINGDDDLYKRDLSKPDNEKITSGNIASIQVSADGKMITYLNEYNFDKLKGELYYVNEGDEPKKIASDVTYYQICNDGNTIYYLNEEKNLLCAELGKEERTKISGDIVYFSASYDGDYVIFENTEGALYLNPVNGEKEKLGDSIKQWDVLNNGSSIVYLSEDTELFINEPGKEKSKLASDVQNYVVSEYDNSISFYTKDYQLIHKPYEQEGSVIALNLRDYNYVTFSDSLVFEKKLLLDDLKGIWYADNYGDELIFEITNDYNINIYDEGEIKLTSPVKLEEGYSNSGNLVIQQDTNNYLDGAVNYNVEYNSTNEIILDDVTFMKIEKNGLDAKLQAQKAAYEEEQRVLAEEQALQNIIDEAWEIAYDILYTYQYVTVDYANFYENPSIDAYSFGTLNFGYEFYIEDTYVDEEGQIWCYLGAYDEYGDYLTGWTQYYNFQ